MNIKLIIWDWNGTLLNDVDFSIVTINKILTKYNLNKIDADYHRKIFTFPVKDYYKKLGFNFDQNPFTVVGKEFIDIYNLGINSCKLHENVELVLSKIKFLQIQQVIISAREHSSLLKDVESLGISDYFESIDGISDNYASSKLYLFEEVMNRYNYLEEEILLIGDTTHDCEIAKELNINFIHFSKGHQNISHFKKYDNILSVDSLDEIFNIITF